LLACYGFLLPPCCPPRSSSFLSFFTTPATTALSPLSLHDALPIYRARGAAPCPGRPGAGIELGAPAAGASIELCDVVAIRPETPHFAELGARGGSVLAVEQSPVPRQSRRWAGSKPPRPSGRPRASIAAAPSAGSFASAASRCSTIRDGVTDFGIVTMPWARCQASTTCAGVAP